MNKLHKTISVCGIDTDVGKSVVTGLLAKHLFDRGESVTTLKLVQTGCTDESEDIRLHRELMQQPLTEFDKDGTTCPYLFPFPASPKLAAEMIGKQIESATLDRVTEKLQQHYQWLLVEGAGGLLVPLNSELILLDYLAAKNYPVILVTSPKLGSINHTRLSLEALKQRGMHLLGLVYNLHGDNPREIVQDSLRECRKALADNGFSDKVVIMPDTGESTATNWQILLEGIS